MRDLSRSFSVLRVLNRVNLAVEQGSITGLIGPNGAGKSTLFNIVSGFLEADAGTVLYAGMQIGRLSVARRSHLGLVRSFQTPQVFAHLSVRENLIAGCYKHTRSGMLASLLGT